ncbi:MAG: hypothetical protein BHV69_09425 [Bacteroidales bacterium 52_46]|nr:MAG: hypothetical protein BHV69_09425 [Bacteroidales bacterium 52_46]
MNTQDKNQITEYLAGSRDYSEGVSLYQRFGQNLRLKRLFVTDDTQTTKEILFEELRKLAGLTELEFAHLPRRAATPKPTLNGKTVKAIIFDDPKEDNEVALKELADSFGVTVDELVSPDFQERVLAMDENANRIEELTDQLDAARSKYAETPEPVRKMIRFREKYPFLNSPDCPNVLKVLVADMFTSYDNYKSAHARLQVLADDETAAAVADCEKVVTEYLKNREIWDELEYYRENGAILGKAAKFREMEAAEDYTQLSEIDLMKKLQSANVNESKHRKAVNTAKEKGETNDRAEAALARWSATKKAIQEEVARRKKK